MENDTIIHETSGEFLSSESIAKISVALVKAQAKFQAVAKAGTNKEQGYKFASLINFIEASEEGLRDHDLAVLTFVRKVIQLPTVVTKTNTTWYNVRVIIGLRLIHTSAEWIEISSFGDGRDTSDKAIYKAITGARKYGLASLLNLATTDDPEKDDPQDRRNGQQGNQQQRGGQQGNYPQRNGQQQQNRPQGNLPQSNQQRGNQPQRQQQDAPPPLPPPPDAPHPADHEGHTGQHQLQPPRSAAPPQDNNPIQRQASTANNQPMNGSTTLTNEQASEAVKNAVAEVQSLESLRETMLKGEKALLDAKYFPDQKTVISTRNEKLKTRSIMDLEKIDRHVIEDYITWLRRTFRERKGIAEQIPMEGAHA